MPVGVLYYATRDTLDKVLKDPENLMFTSKAEADARDKMLEVAEAIESFLHREIPELPEEHCIRLSELIADRRELFARAMKKPSLLSQAGEASADQKPRGSTDDSENETEQGKETSRKPAKAL